MALEHAEPTTKAMDAIDLTGRWSLVSADVVVLFFHQAKPTNRAAEPHLVR